MLRSRRVAVIAALAFSATAAEATGLALSNPATLARAAALPLLDEPPLLPAGEQRWSLQLDATSEFVSEATARESLLVDAETERLALRWRRSFSPEWQLGLELPLLSTGGGSLDGFIEGWHSTFGLPNGGRETQPRDQYRIRYVRDGVTALDRDHGSSGLGDARITLMRALASDWRLSGQLQLPTGDADRLTGGHAGVALWAGYTPTVGPVQLGLSAGGSYSEAKGPLAALQRKTLVFASANLAWTLPVDLPGRLEALLQLNGHQAPYRDSEVDALATPALMLVAGGRYRWGHQSLSLAFQEDPAVNTAPDFSLSLAYDF